LPRTERIHISDLPDATVDCVCDAIATFTVGLTRNVREGNRERAFLIGTGTLVTVNRSHCILTAGHVVAQLGDSDYLGLVSSFAGRYGRQVFEKSILQIHAVGPGQDESKGPDIAVVVLPQAQIGSLLAEKSFFSIDNRRARFAEAFLEKNRGFWFMVGVVGESEEQLDPIPGSVQTKAWWGLCGRFSMPREYEELGFDYLDVQVDYRTAARDLPSSFGGFSGAGVWQVPLRKNREGDIEAEEFVLSGVAFYQTPLADGARHLKCHGRRAVYEKIPELVQRTARS